MLLPRNVKSLLEFVLSRAKTIFYVKSKSWRKRLSSRLSKPLCVQKAKKDSTAAKY